MRGVSIADRDERNVLKVDLADILSVVGEATNDSAWKLSEVEALGEAEARELHRLSDLLRLAKEVSQVIDGEFQAYRGASETPWLIIRAVDSAAYDVVTDDDEVLARLRKQFSEVEDIQDN